MKAIKKPIMLEELISFSFAITGHYIVVHNTTTDKNNTLKSIWSDCRLDMKYSIDNSICSFITESVQYVVPVFSGIRSILENAGFTESNFSVLFTITDVPLIGGTKWCNMKKQVLKWNVREAREACRDYSKRHGILPLQDEIVLDSTEIPFSGLLLSKFGEHFYIYPNLKESTFSSGTPSEVSCYVLEHLGTFNYSNGFCLINAEDGRSYVSVFSSFLYERLKRNGYRLINVHVPLSIGERIV